MRRDEPVRRIGPPDRAAFGTLRSVELPMQLSEDFAGTEAAMPAAGPTLDMDRTRPDDAAARIVELI